MAFARPDTTTANLAAADGLARVRGGLFRGRMIQDATVDAGAKLQRAKERLYVLCQAGGWSFFLVTQLVFIHLFGVAKDTTSDNVYFSMIRIVAEGLLITHYVRPLMKRWGWKELGWRPLIPRIIGLGLLMSLAWCVAGYSIDYLLLQTEPPKKYPLWLLFSTSWLNGTIMMAGWLGIYFFYNVFERLRWMQVDQLQLSASAKDAELRALKSQINPHFLFNSLNSLRALIDEDPPRAREAVTRMANMLRYSLQSGQLGTVALDEELRIVEDYLALEQIRHENRLRVRWEVAENVRDNALTVPPMLLQTLVENAVKYGIGTRREGGEIVIGVALAGDSLSIRVTNPGQLTANGSDASTGVGLRNASERLKLLFGEQATLELKPVPAGCVTAEVKIPLDEVDR